MKLGATGTPLFIVGNRVINSAAGYATLKKAVAAGYDALKKAVAAGYDALKKAVADARAKS